MTRPAAMPGGRVDAKVGALLTSMQRGGRITADCGGGFRLAADGARASGEPAKRVSAGLVETCLAQDWLERSGDDLVLSQAGLAWLRRAAADGDPFRQQHQLRTAGEREIDGTRRPVLLNGAESPLGWLKNRKDRNWPVSDLRPSIRGRRALACRLLVRASEPARDVELVGARSRRAAAPVRAIECRAA